MATAVAKRKETAMGRSPKVLAPLIEEELALGKEASRDHDIAVGELYLEAWPGLPGTKARGNYIRERGDTRDHATACMRLARSESLQLGHASKTAALKDPRTRSQAPWRRDREDDHVQETTVNKEKRLADFRLERRVQRAEMLLLVGAGYKQLAAQRHPDKGGSDAAFTLLKEVRDLLIKYAENWK